MFGSVTVLSLDDLSLCEGAGQGACVYCVWVWRVG